MFTKNGYQRIDEAHSDSEAVGVQLSSSAPIIPLKKKFLLGKPIYNDFDDEYDENGDLIYHHDNEFGESFAGTNKLVRTGRQRKKQSARSKGSEFQSRRKKRRVYFCCVSSEIDIQKLYDYMIHTNDSFGGWKLKLHNDVLHLYKAGSSDESQLDVPKRTSNDIPIPPPDLVSSFEINDEENIRQKINPTQTVYEDELLWKISLSKAQEIFIFDFGAVVFWGFSRGEETNLLKTIRLFVTKGFVGESEFQSGEDDMAFVITPSETAVISIANEVFSLPDDISPKQRLSVSFAIAQSSGLAIFESRIENLIEEYKYIPEVLAAHGKARLSERQLGTMIGEVFVIRHDVNLHSEILDTPDFFWKQEDIEKDYKMVSEIF